MVIHCIGDHPSIHAERFPLSVVVITACPAETPLPVVRLSRNRIGPPIVRTPITPASEWVVPDFGTNTKMRVTRLIARTSSSRLHVFLVPMARDLRVEAVKTALIVIKPGSPNSFVWVLKHSDPVVYEFLEGRIPECDGVTLIHPTYDPLAMEPLPEEKTKPMGKCPTAWQHLLRDDE